MAWYKREPYPFRKGDKVYVSKTATTIDKRICGKVATVEYSTYKLVQVRHKEDVWVFPCSEVELFEKAVGEGD